MTDNEIIKALECCNLQRNGNCTECPLRYSGDWWVCSAIILKSALDLINRQNAEIARLQTDVAPIRRGEWASEETAVTCTACGRSYDTDFEIKRNVISNFDYCPNCGAKMDGDKNG